MGGARASRPRVDRIALLPDTINAMIMRMLPARSHVAFSAVNRAMRKLSSRPDAALRAVRMTKIDKGTVFALSRLRFLTSLHMPDDFGDQASQMWSVLRTGLPLLTHLTFWTEEVTSQSSLTVQTKLEQLMPDVAVSAAIRNLLRDDFVFKDGGFAALLSLSRRLQVLCMQGYANHPNLCPALLRIVDKMGNAILIAQGRVEPRF